MSTIGSISLNHITKEYKIGNRQAYSTLRDSLSSLGNRLHLFRQRPSPDIFTALKDISVDIAPGEVVGVIGRNGAGKSTLLKVLSRITPPTSGSATVHGRVASLLEVGTGFHPELTGRENIFLNGSILGMTQREVRAKFNDIVNFSENETFLDTPVKHYSSGMYTRLAFAVAAHLEPDILLIDEVLSVGDTNFQEKSLGKMNQVAKNGRTVIFVSHNMAAIEAICQKAIYLDQGRLIKYGPTRLVIDTYIRHATQTRLSRTTGGKHLHSLITRDKNQRQKKSFLPGEDIIFELGLRYPKVLKTPRLSIGILNARGQRLVTLHTDIQNKLSWQLTGNQKAIAIWKNPRLVPGTYHLDISLWGYSHEIECLYDCYQLTIINSDFYGSGMLPDSASQGYYLADVNWILPHK